MKSPTYNSILLILENVLRLVVGVFLSVWMARTLGPEDYGTFSYVISFVAIFATIYVFGNEDLLVKELHRRGEAMHGTVMKAAFVMRFLAGLFGMALCNLIAFLISPDDKPLLIFIFLLSFATLFKSFQAADQYFFAKQNLQSLVWTRNAIFLLISVGKFTLLYLGADLAPFIWISGLEIVLFGLTSLFLYLKASKSLEIAVANNFKSTLKTMALESTPIMIVALAMMGMSKIDQVMIAHFHGEAILGQYAVATKLVDFCAVIPVIFVSSYFPKILGGPTEEQDGRFSYLFGLLFWVSLAGALAFQFLASPVIGLLYGETYTEAASYLPSYAWLMLVFFYVFAQQRYLMAQQKMSLILKIALAGLILNIALNFYLVPLYQVPGAILGTFLSYLIVQSVGAIFVKSLRESALLLIAGVKVIVVERKVFP